MSGTQHSGVAAGAQTEAALTGYRDSRYAASLAEFGRPRELPRCGGWILERPVGGTGQRDAMGCYPIFACRDWSQVGADLDALDDLAAVSLVTDPFGACDEERLRRCFPDLVVPFKQHYVVDLDAPRPSKHHRYYARKALAALRVEPASGVPDFLDEWVGLHQQLVAKHRVAGIRAFSRGSFAQQFAIPGFSALRALSGGEPVAAMMFVQQDEVVHAHVLGCTPLGYRSGALYALIATAIERFRGAARWCNLMGVPGGTEAGGDGIRQFKRGWTSHTRQTYLCGRVINRRCYAELAARAGHANDYFPAYRRGELV